MLVSAALSAGRRDRARGGERLGPKLLTGRGRLRHWRAFVIVSVILIYLRRVRCSGRCRSWRACHCRHRHRSRRREARGNFLGGDAHCEHPLHRAHPEFIRVPVIHRFSS
jgi:hypothetical protein